MRLPTHDSYGFHITLAYRLIEPEPGEAAAIEQWVREVDSVLQSTFGMFDTGQPELSFFDDMVRFVPESDYHTLSTR